MYHGGATGGSGEARQIYVGDVGDADGDGLSARRRWLAISIAIEAAVKVDRCVGSQGRVIVRRESVGA